MVNHRMAFGPLVIEFSDQVLRPRPWTLAQAEWAAELADAAPTGPLLELCSGVGQIGLALASLCADRGRPRDLVLVDADPEACRLARVNADQPGMRSPVEIREAPLSGALRASESFAVIVADPPWVPSHSTTQYPEDPLWAIDGGTDGLDVARRCVEAIARHLHPGGAAVVQLGTADQVEDLARDLGPELEVVEQRAVPGANGVLVRLAAAQSPPGPVMVGECDADQVDGRTV